MTHINSWWGCNSWSRQAHGGCTIYTASNNPSGYMETQLIIMKIKTDHAKVRTHSCCWILGAPCWLSCSYCKYSRWKASGTRAHSLSPLKHGISKQDLRNLMSVFNIQYSIIYTLQPLEKIPQDLLLVPNKHVNKTSKFQMTENLGSGEAKGGHRGYGLQIKYGVKVTQLEPSVNRKQLLWPASKVKSMKKKLV